jgi:hypothetical protein
VAAQFFGDAYGENAQVCEEELLEKVGSSEGSGPTILQERTEDRTHAQPNRHE